MIFISPCEIEIPYIVLVLSRTIENRKPTKNANIQSRMDRFPMWSEAKIAEISNIPLHLLITFVALYWSKPLKVSSSTRPVHIIRMSDAPMKE